MAGRPGVAGSNPVIPTHRESVYAGRRTPFLLGGLSGPTCEHVRTTFSQHAPLADHAAASAASPRASGVLATGQRDRVRDARRVRLPCRTRTGTVDARRRRGGHPPGRQPPPAALAGVLGDRSKGERAYAWGWIATTHPHRFLLIRRHLRTGELAYHYCSVPSGRPVTVMTLVRVACLRWPVEGDFEFGKDHFGLGHRQVRLYTALLRHIVLTLAALAVCAITAAQARIRAPAPILPTAPDERPPEDVGLIALTVAEVKRLFLLVIRRLQPETHHLHWVWWRRRHHARARWSHHRARLRRQIDQK